MSGGGAIFSSMGVSPEEAVSRLRERLSNRSPEDLRAEASAKALLPALASALRNAGARRVVLFGSLATGLFHHGSDIDLAVIGLTEVELARLEHELTLRAGRAVELSNLETAPRALRESINRFGVSLL
jgi:predicted nucleotidyltransferase